MIWPPTRPVRKRWFGVVFLAIWTAGMFLCWLSIAESWTGGGMDRQGVTRSMHEITFGFSEWLTWSEIIHESTQIKRTEHWQVEPRGLAVALIMTALSSLILYVGWRAAVGGFACARGTCDGCGYDLRALSASRCPECGEVQGGAERDV